MNILNNKLYYELINHPSWIDIFYVVLYFNWITFFINRICYFVIVNILLILTKGRNNFSTALYCIVTYLTHNLTRK